jgi:hypothetical protein
MSRLSSINIEAAREPSHSCGEIIDVSIETLHRIKRLIEVIMATAHVVICNPTEYLPPYRLWLEHVIVPLSPTEGDFLGR